MESLHDPEHEKRVIALQNVLDSFDTGMHPEAQHTGYYNDLDMMVMGMRGMTDAMERIHMGLWALASAPLMVGSDLTRLSAETLSVLTNKEALAIHNDPYGLQPIKVAEPAVGIEVWAKPMTPAGRRTVALLNRTDALAQGNIDWGKLGLHGVPRSLRDVWSGRTVAPESAFFLPAHDLVLLSVDGEDKKPAEYPASKSTIVDIRATGGPTFAQLEYVNRSGRVAVARVTSKSGFSTALALPPTTGPDTGTVGLILPRGTADLRVDAQRAVIQRLLVYYW